MVIRGLARCHPAVLLSLVLPLCGCGSLRLVGPSQVVLNGRAFLFDDIQSLRPVSEEPFEEFVYDRGDFHVKTSADTVLVNGVEISTEPGGARVANRRVRLRPGESLRFASDMQWRVVGDVPRPRAVPASSPAVDDGRGEASGTPEGGGT